MKSMLLKTSPETEAMLKVQTVETIDEALKSIAITVNFEEYLVQIVCPDRYPVSVFPAPGWGITWPREYLPSVLHGIAAMSNEMLQAARRSGHSCVHATGAHPNVYRPSSLTTHPQKETYA